MCLRKIVISSGKKWTVLKIPTTSETARLLRLCWRLKFQKRYDTFSETHVQIILLHQVLTAINHVASIVNKIIGIRKCVLIFGITNLLFFIWIYHDVDITWKYWFSYDRMEHKHLFYTHVSYRSLLMCVY